MKIKVPRNPMKPGGFGCHEALHMTSVIIDMLEKHLIDHPAIELNPEWSAKADAAMDILCDLYQDIGAAHIK